MRRVLLGLCLVIACDDDGEGSTAAEGTTGAQTSGETTPPTAGETEDPSDPSNATTGATQTTATSEPPTTDPTASTGPTSGGSTGDGSSGSGSTGEGDTGSGSTTGEAGMTFADIQVDLENVGGAQGDYPSCIDGGGACHANPARNVVLVSNPNAAELMANYQAIINAPATPWVTPLDDSAQMLNEVAIPDDVRARWLAWIQAGAPFE